MSPGHFVPVRRRMPAVLTGVVLAFMVMARGSPAAHAHALLAASEPADGARLERSPSQALLTFTEAPDPVLSIVHVIDSSGRSVETGKAQAVPGQSAQLRVPLGALAQGTYTVSWRTTSAVDGHTTAGSFAFGVGVAAPPADDTAPGAVRSPPPTPVSVVGRWLFYVGLALLVGAAVVGVAVSRTPARIPRPALLSAWVIAVAGLVMMIGDQRATARTTLARLLSSATGHKVVAEAIALALVAVAVVWACLRRGRLALSAVGAAAAATMLARARAGHADASSARWFTVGAQWIHLVSAGAWVGGLVWLLLLLRQADPLERARLARRFSAVAAAALAVVVVSGTLRALDEVGAWSRLVHTGFGETLLVKVGLVASLVALGAGNRLRLVPAAVGGRIGGLRRAVRGEVGVAAGVLGATAVLAGLAPSASLAAASKPRPTPQVTVTGSDYATTMRVRLVVTPGAAGPNRFDATVADYDTGSPIPADSVALRFQSVDRPDIGAATSDLARAPDSHWRAQGSGLSIDGRWRVTALVQTPTAAAEVPMELTTLRPPQRVEVSRTPGLPDIYTITLTSGRRAQTYVDPGRSGLNQVHMTILEGPDELALDSGQIDAIDAKGGRQTLSVRRLGPGHFVADADLDLGTWRFELQADARDGSHLVAEFTDLVRS